MMEKAKSIKILKLLRELQATRYGISTFTLCSKYEFCPRTLKRYLKDFRVAGYDVQNLAVGVNNVGVWKIDL